jgi:hypothetical protein
MHPYTENPMAKTYGRTRNWRDSYNIFEDAFGPEGKYNPIFKMHLLGGVVRQGLIGYITMVSSIGMVNDDLKVQITVPSRVSTLVRVFDIP